MFLNMLLKSIYMVSLWTWLLLKDLCHAVKNLSIELYAKDVHLNSEKYFKRYEYIDRKYTKICKVQVRFQII